MAGFDDSSSGWERPARLRSARRWHEVSAVPVVVAVLVAVLTVVATTPKVVEASALSEYEAAVAADNPLGWWKLDETSGSSAADSASVGSGTIVGGVTKNVQGPFGSTSKAYAFDGSSCSGVDLSAHRSSFNRNTFTLEAWVKTTASLAYLFRYRTHSSSKQLQSKFKHAADFGVAGNYSKANAAKYSAALNKHINSSSVTKITGTYRGNPVTHYLDRSTGLNVIVDPSGAFVSGWKLGPEQLMNVLKHGGLT